MTVTKQQLYMSSAGILREVRTVTGGLNHRPTDSLPKDRRHRAHIMVRGSDRDSLVVLPGTRDIKESGAYVRRGSMSGETQDTSPRMLRYLDLPMPKIGKSRRGRWRSLHSSLSGRKLPTVTKAGR